MLDKALAGARLLYFYTLHIEAPLAMVFDYTGNPDNWTPPQEHAHDWLAEAIALAGKLGIA